MPDHPNYSPLILQKFVENIQTFLEFIVSNRHEFVYQSKTLAQDIKYKFDRLLPIFPLIQKSIETTPANQFLDAGLLSRNVYLQYENFEKNYNSIFNELPSVDEKIDNSYNIVPRILDNANIFLKALSILIPETNHIIDFNTYFCANLFV
ncbi:hypothetical protein A2Y85_06995 [candidate division WOR-3 bacterium RBG_13_43_14]|uniref:Uncharacterized protein n=1 Tax=candidate division WOR-3 bacterium RBG_13_43_14 TaxID=1802590 RepID=A0A1F4UAM5_UNCW3|nr:MAG: hypothetical protein A2Y85_06995 [candidate division WOR-3 bacterium RBG_13_43_14]